MGDLCTIFYLIFILDVAGVMTGVEGEKKYLKNEKLIDMLVIHIENDGLKLNAAVFREIVDQIKGFVATGEITSEIIENDTNILQNIMYGTKLLINPDVPEARNFTVPICAFRKSVYVAEDEVLYSTERKTIKELCAAADVGFYVVLTTVLNVEPVSSWWYKSRVYSVKAEANVDTYFCDGCNKDVNNVVDRYKLDLLVFDGTVTTTFVVFDKEAATLFGRTCNEMVKELNRGGGTLKAR
ncbi:uncharacterized protein LOC107620956 [Arachis ipaensis]|uniref:uncharacterized protein LOC107620956 n=1 Tax=Arachis ipaensis TaxID=130454 RepID=UPI0007AF9BE3|nr:uncharacterized protein LOC107620956 [Arachis ipaensis]